MELSLDEITVVCPGRRLRRARDRRLRGVLLLLRARRCRPSSTGRRTQLVALKADITKGVTTAKQLPAFETEVNDLEARLDNLRAVLPEEKDAADLLRRMQTVAHAVQPGHQELQAGAGRHQAAPRRVADHAGARGLVSQPRDLLRPRRQVHPHREHHRRRRERAGPARRCQRDDYRHLRGDDVRAARRPRAGRGESQAAPKKAALSHAQATAVARIEGRAGHAQARPPHRLALADACAAAPAQPPAKAPARRTGAPGAAAPGCVGPDAGRRLHLSARRPARSVPESAGHRRDPRATGRKRAEGAAGLTVAEITVRGVLESRGALIAMIQAPDKKTYIVHAGRQVPRRHDSIDHAAGARHRSGSQRSAVAREAAGDSQIAAFAGKRQGVAVKRGLALFLTVVDRRRPAGRVRRQRLRRDHRRRAADDHQLARPQQRRVARDRGDRPGRIRRRASRSADHHRRLPQRRRRRRGQLRRVERAAVRSPACPWNRWSRSARRPRASRITLSQPVAHHVRSDRNTIVIDLDKPTGQAVRPAGAPPNRTAGRTVGARRHEGARRSSQSSASDVDPLGALGLTGAPPALPQTTGAPALNLANRAAAAAAGAGTGASAAGAGARQAQTQGQDRPQGRRDSRAIRSASTFRAPICAPCSGASPRSAA